jgi:hypothetical protein
VQETEPVVMSVWIFETRREDEPERNVSVYVVLAGSAKSFIVFIHDVSVCRSATRSQRISGSSTRSLNGIKLDIVSSFVVAKTQDDNLHGRLSLVEVMTLNGKEGNSSLLRQSNSGFLCKSEFLSITVKAGVMDTIINASTALKSVSSYNVFLASMGIGSSICLRCAKTDLSKSMNMLGWCSLIMAQELRSDRVSMLAGFQIINTRTLLASGCTQTRRGSQRYTRLYEKTPVITSCLVCNFFKCQ